MAFKKLLRKRDVNEKYNVNGYVFCKLESYLISCSYNFK